MSVLLYEIVVREHDGKALFRPEAELTHSHDKKSPKHSEHVFWQKNYFPATENRGRQSEWRGQTFDWKLPI